MTRHEDPSPERWRTAKTVLVPLLGLCLVLLVMLTLRMEAGQPYKTYQKAYLESQADRLRSSLSATHAEEEIRARVEALRRTPLRIKEIRPALTGRVERCLTCHDGIEEISPSHPVDAFGCVTCHGGDGRGVTVEIAHRGLIGGRNPSDLAVIDQTCAKPGGQCHAGRTFSVQNSADRVRSGVMATMSGVIAGLRYSWAAQPSSIARYASVGVKASRGGTDNRIAGLLTIPLMSPIPGINPTDARGFSIQFSGEAADDQWRKFCARCHLWSKREEGPSAHSSGCAACHALYNTNATYEGMDPTLPKDKPGYARQHRLTTHVPVEQCLRCHNRSGRIGLSYTGLQEADGYGTPYRQGRPDLAALSGGRDVRRLVPDVHFEKGLACVDCHTGNDVMGDGRIYSHMRDQVEIRCTDCHGTPNDPPPTRLQGPEDEEALWRARTLKLSGIEGKEVGLTQRGTPLLNLWKENGRMILQGKLDQKEHPCPVITGSVTHRIPGHGPDRMECSACHTRWAPQCYGCHDYRRQGEPMLDSMLGIETAGMWQETRDYYRFEKPVLGVSSRGRVSVFMPGCQVVYTELGPDNQPVPGRDKMVFRGPGFGHGIISTPISPHATRAEVRSCRECHADPKTLGLGQGFFTAGRDWDENFFTSLVKPEINPMGFAWETLTDPRGRPLAASTHPGARPFNQEELKRILRVAPCLPCHGRYDDPIWENPREAFERARLPAHQKKVARVLEGAP